jgi:hypothetical protein
MRCVLLALATVLILSAGCGGRAVAGPLVGTWTYTAKVGYVRTIAVRFNADGTADEVLTLGDPGVASSDTCSGTPTLSGYSWTATATELTLTGSPTCSGAITCLPGWAGLNGPCTFPMYSLMLSGGPNGEDAATQVAGACQYTLSDDGKTLTLDQCTQTVELPPPPVQTPAIVGDPTDQLASYTLTRST